MISEENILTFPFIFFYGGEISLQLPHYYAERSCFFWTLFWIKLSWFAFLFSELCIVCTWLSNSFYWTFYLGQKGGGRLLPPSLMLSPFTIGKIDSVKLNIRDFPSKFSCLIFFFLLVYCFYALRPLQIVFVAWSCGAGGRDIRSFEWGRVWGIAPCFPSCQSLPY